MTFLDKVTHKSFPPIETTLQDMGCHSMKLQLASEITLEFAGF